jgi:hypothetical protein
MANWNYKAYDANFVIHEGYEVAKDFPQLSIILRQRGLQILEATRLTKDGVLAAERYAKMRAKVEPECGDPQQGTPARYAIHKLFLWMISAFLKRPNG